VNEPISEERRQQVVAELARLAGVDGGRGEYVPSPIALSAAPPMPESMRPPPPPAGVEIRSTWDRLEQSQRQRQRHRQTAGPQERQAAVPGSETFAMLSHQELTELAALLVARLDVVPPGPNNVRSFIQWLKGGE